MLERYLLRVLCNKTCVARNEVQLGIYLDTLWSFSSSVVGCTARLGWFREDWEVLWNSIQLQALLLKEDAEYLSNVLDLFQMLILDLLYCQLAGIFELCHLSGRLKKIFLRWLYLNLSVRGCSGISISNSSEIVLLCHQLGGFPTGFSYLRFSMFSLIQYPEQLDSKLVKKTFQFYMYF